MSSCPLCKRVSEKDFFGLPNYYHCNNCSIAWQIFFLKSPYKESYYKGTSNFIHILFSPISRLFYLIRERYVGKKNIGLWIDVGAGDGGLLKCIKAKEKIGVEISASGRRKMEEIGLKTLTDQEFLKVSGLNADVISFWHVLEHTQNPWMYLRSAYRNLAKGGTIVIGIPNFDSFEFKFFKKHWFHLDHRHHFWHFSSKSINNVVIQEGFEIKKNDYWSLEHHLAGVLQSFINITSNSDNILHRLVKRGEDSTRFSLKGAFCSIFWLTAGLPIVVTFLIIASLSKKSGTMVVIAEKKA
ncbi:MAG: class I SAM-dependent methyltransferase [bacterium]|nr:class I SAM-dependent methyltransferase [bacterium]